MNMRRTIIILAAMAGMGGVPGLMAQNTGYITPGVAIENFDMNRSGRFLTVEMDMDLTAMSVDANRAVLLTPRLVNGADSLDLPSVGIYGRNRYYYYLRNGEGSISGDDETIYRASGKPGRVAYSKLTEYKDWMDGATLKFHRSDWGCCRSLLAEYEGILGRHSEAFFPELVFVRPEAEIMKSRSLSGLAYIDFPVDQTVIYPDYRRNTEELGKIQATIDSVRYDRDVTITSVWLKGYASPESPYSHNTELAKGRTAALKKHIGQLYHFADDVIRTEYEPEDWDGLRRFVEQSNISHREDILAMIDSDMEADAKEAKIKRTYPEEYRFMLEYFYPALRHTDYRLDYNVRTFSETEEIKRIMAERPQKLSQNEFYLVARDYEPGTEEFADVFETAVRMYPEDEIANLNAANAAIRRDDFGTARKYLAKAGDSAEAAYARGALAIREGDFETAREYLGQAMALGLEQAGRTLAELDERQK